MPCFAGLRARSKSTGRNRDASAGPGETASGKRNNSTERAGPPPLRPNSSDELVGKWDGRVWAWRGTKRTLVPERIAMVGQATGDWHYRDRVRNRSGHDSRRSNTEVYSIASISPDGSLTRQGSITTGPWTRKSHSKRKRDIREESGERIVVRHSPVWVDANGKFRKMINAGLLRKLLDSTLRTTVKDCFVFRCGHDFGDKTSTAFVHLPSYMSAAEACDTINNMGPIQYLFPGNEADGWNFKLQAEKANARGKHRWSMTPPRVRSSPTWQTNVRSETVQFSADEHYPTWDQRGRPRAKSRERAASGTSDKGKQGQRAHRNDTGSWSDWSREEVATLACGHKVNDLRQDCPTCRDRFNGLEPRAGAGSSGNGRYNPATGCNRVPLNAGSSGGTGEAEKLPVWEPWYISREFICTLPKAPSTSDRVSGETGTTPSHPPPPSPPAPSNPPPLPPPSAPPLDYRVNPGPSSGPPPGAPADVAHREVSAADYQELQKSLRDKVAARKGIPKRSQGQPLREPCRRGRTPQKSAPARGHLQCQSKQKVLLPGMVAIATRI